MTAPYLHFDSVCRDFGPVRVLHDVTFDVTQGEVHALIGENGAGKSTLMKIAAGFLQPTEGRVLLEGEGVLFHGPREAEARGVVLIHQEFNLAESLTVEENINLGHEAVQGAFLDLRTLHAKAAQALAEVGVNLDLRARVRDLIVPQRQMVEIAKAVSREARLLIMDEPTATLTPSEVDVLFALIERLKARGVTILYISHKLDEVKRIADRVTVLRDGHHVGTYATSELSQHDMANLMVGRELEDMFPEKRIDQSAEVVLEARGVSVPGWASDVSFTLRKGEVLGFAGLVGAGRTELFEGVLGLRHRSAGTILVHGNPVSLTSPLEATRAGIAYLSEDRKGKGLHVDFLLRPNVTLMALKRFARPLLDFAAEQRALEGAVREYGVRTGRLAIPVSALSGGNQQKLAIAKILETVPEIIVLDEPTRGVDVGAKRDIYFLVGKLAAAGKSVVLISSELPEVLGLSHRVVVMRQGQVAGVLSGENLTENEVIQHATGLKGAKPNVAA